MKFEKNLNLGSKSPKVGEQGWMSDLVKMSMTMLKKKHEKWVGPKNFLITKKDVFPNYNNGQCLAMGTFPFYSKKNCVLIYH